jgi:hypothetical protein
MTTAARIEQLALLFLPSVRLIVLPHDADARHDGVVVVEALRMGELEPASVRDGKTAVLVVPDTDDATDEPPASATVLVGVERHDALMASKLLELLNPDRVTLELMHVAWLTGIVPSQNAGAGIDNPQPSELVAYDGAKEALIDRAEELRSGEFQVATHLREDRETLHALRAAAERLAPELVVLGHGRHGLGLGRALLAERRLPVLYVAARAQ